VKVGASASIQDSLVYNGCIVKGHVERSILFPGVQVEKGAVVEDSVLFFNNIVKKNVHLKKTVSDVNNTFGAGVKMNVGNPTAGQQQTTVVGWNNTIPDSTIIGNGSTIYPHMEPEKIPGVIKTGEVVRDES
jgi:glucose-1-phosphate adenylyltransferase